MSSLAWPISRTPGQTAGFTTGLARPWLVVAPACVGVVAYLMAMSWAMQHASQDIWGGMIVLPVLLAVTLPLATRGARREGDAAMVRILALAVVVKLVVGTLARYAVIFEVYGTGDAQGYDGAGRLIAESFRNGNFAVDLGGGGEGTQVTSLVSGIVYTIIGPSKLGGFFVFSWFALLGMFLIYRAYRIAFPEGDHRRYAKLLFFLPTIWFWPSSLGKESLMMLTVGLSVYGAARIFARQRGGFVVLCLGMWTTTMVRPHLVILVFAGLAVGYLLRRAPGEGRRLSPGKIFGLVVLVAVGVVVAGRFQDYFKLDDLDSASVNQLLESTAEKSRSDDGSDYDAVSAAQNPWTFPQAVAAVLFRPFPFEANNLQSLATSAEGAFLLWLFARRWRHVVAGARAFVRSAFVALCVTYSFLFIVAFSSIGNFGILARQRSLVYPMVLVLITVPLASRAVGRRRRSSPTVAPG